MSSRLPPNCTRKRSSSGPRTRLEAAQRRAILLRDKLGKKAEADQVIDAMVKAAPDDYRAYLGRGRYREGSGDKKAGDDFRKAMELAPDRPEVYLEVARAVERESGPDAARRILDKGLAAMPKAAELYLQLAALEGRAGRAGRAIEALELGVKALPDLLELRWQLALLLARRGEAESGRLRLQIAELDRLRTNRVFTQYLTAFDQFNHHEFADARRILTSLQPDVARNPGLKSMVNLLLARVHGELGEADQQQEALLRAISTNPDDLSARLGWIGALLNRGELDEAIREYQALYAQQPAIAREPLVANLIELTIDRVAALPEARRQWGECEQLIAGVEASNPGAIEAKLLRARLMLEQGQEAKAYDVVETVRRSSPRRRGPGRCRPRC